MEIPGGGGGSQKPKVLKESMKPNWNFCRGGGFKVKSNLWGRYGYFLEPHNLKTEKTAIPLRIASSSLVKLFCDDSEAHSGSILVLDSSNRESPWLLVLKYSFPSLKEQKGTRNKEIS